MSFLYSLRGCSYGQEDRRNHVMLEYQLFSLIISVSMSFLLLGSEKLRRIYAPLSNIVNIALILQLLSTALFFIYFPYDEEHGNCSEIFLRRIFIVSIMFGELHQVYFIANVLGINRYRFQLGGGYSISLETMLRIATVVVIVTVLSSLIIRRLFMLFRNVWGLFIISLQLYFIDYARKHQSRREDEEASSRHSEALIDVNHEAVNIFESLSWLQIIPTSIAFVYRLIEFYEYRYYGSIDAVMLILDCVCNAFFYIKVIVLQEKGNAVTIQIVED